jgi:protein-tyrosine phosphatase
MNNLLFVCMGNICRSPVAEYVVRSEFARAGLDVAVASAGTGPWHLGKPADARSVASAAVHGYDLSAHRARQVQREDFSRYDLVLAMDRQNLADLLARCPPDRADRVALFLPFAEVAATAEVPDPYYGGPEDFDRVIELARAGARGLARKLAAVPPAR